MKEFRVRVGEQLGEVGRAASLFTVAFGISLSSRKVHEVRKVFYFRYLEVRSFGGGADFVAQQKMLPCATNDAVLRNKGVGGCARRLAERGGVSSKERSAHLLSEKCAPFK